MQRVHKCAWGQLASSPIAMGFLPWVLAARCEVTTYFSQVARLSKHGATCISPLPNCIGITVLLLAVTVLTERRILCDCCWEFFNKLHRANSKFHQQWQGTSQFNLCDYCFSDLKQVNECGSNYCLGILNIHGKRSFRDESVLVSYVVVRKIVCTCVLTIEALIHCGCSLACLVMLGLY